MITATLPPRTRWPLIIAVLAALITPWVVTANPQSAQAAPPTIYAPWDAGKEFAIDSPGGQVGGGYYYHTPGETYAVDINGPDGGNTDCGENVRAMNGGTVSIGTYTPSGISYLRIDHGGGYISEYQHVTNRVAAGSTVAQGDVVAKFGNVGATFCHLHFVLRYNGTSVAPSPMSGITLPGSGGIWLTSNNSPPPPPANDFDVDGVTDANDWCPYVYGRSTNRGCPSSITQVSGDLNGDGKDDIIAISRGPDNSPGLSWFQSTSTTSTTSVADPITLGVNLPAPAWNVDGLKWTAGDFNGDGRDDLMAASGSGTSGIGMYMFLSTGTGLSGPTPVKNPPHPGWQWSRLEYFAGDFDGDGRDDIYAISRGPNNEPGINWFRSTSTGMTPSLADGAWLKSMPSPWWNVDNLKWATGDFDGNGKDDLFAASGAQGTGPGMYIFASDGTNLANLRRMRHPHTSHQEPLA